MADIGNAFVIPQFLSAPTPEGLVRAMLRNNIKFGTQFRYRDIQKDGNKWIAWFDMAIDRDKLLEETLTKVKAKGS